MQSYSIKGLESEIHQFFSILVNSGVVCGFVVKICKNSINFMAKILLKLM